MSLETLEVKPRKIIKMMRLLSARMICKESRMQQLLRAKTKFSKRKLSLRNKRKLLPQKPRLEKRKCKLWIRLELRK